MTDAVRLLADARKIVADLVDDLRTVAASDPDAAAHVAAEYQRARAAGRTALGQAEWAEGPFAQVAVAWTLGVVFVRFCEDNGLIDEPLLGGPGDRGRVALDQRAAHLQAHPSHDDRHWLRAVFGRLRALPATGDVFGAHNPVWLDGLLPSADGARRLREGLTGIDPETGALRHDFTDPSWDTRFLGDLYQDLSEHAKKTYALLQTPVFVEEFILDRTLDPAIATFGLAATTLIDPTCGSGHFLLGTFDRLFRRWADAEPGTNRRVLAQRALEAIGGIDLNPFAANIARFRLLLAALRAGGDQRLTDAPAYTLNIAVGDSLLHGDRAGSLPGMHSPGEEEALLAAHGYETEDVPAVRELLSRPWSAVVGNPPYITVKDPALNAAYRARFDSCGGKYSLGVPFTERFWQLAGRDPDASRAGYVGLITANSFMKREMGKKLIERWVPAYDLTHVIDTSGAYIPGHGTPTVILFGRSRRPVESMVRTVMGIRGEPSRPADASKGLVWSSITDLIDDPGSQSDYVSVVDLDRSRLAAHPWSIGGGGAAELKEQLDDGRPRLESAVDSVGITSFTLEDDAYLLDPRSSTRLRVESVRPMVEGDKLRDWSGGGFSVAVFPYGNDFKPLGEALTEPASRYLWRYRTNLRNSKMFGSKTKVESGLHWTEFGRLTANKLRTPLSITFAFKVTHNHFVLDRGGKVFNRTAPVIKLPAGASEDRHLELLGVLNSSTACFWLKQVCQNVGDSTSKDGARVSGAESWIDTYEHDGTKLKQFPLPGDRPTETARRIDRLAQELAASSPQSVAATEVPTAAAIATARDESARLRAEMIAAQEQLDWTCYRLYDLVDDDLTTGDESEPPLQLGERAFEIVLARRIADGEEESSWFPRHRSTPVTELPEHWTPAYQALVRRRIELIETDLNIGLIERPEHKRRWASVPWETQVQTALKGWLLDRLEAPRYWPDPASITTVARLTAAARADADFVSVATLHAGRADFDLAALIGDLVKGEAVAYLAAHRYTDTGLRKHAEWLATWDLQRREDAGDDVGPIPVPPKYAKPDFRGAGWEHRGKLDVPKERFIAYPGAEREADASAVVGWAGWDHLARARALAAWYLQAKRDGRDAAHLTPLLAGLAELVPWLKQWYDDPNPDPALDRPGTQIAALVDTELRALALTPADLTAWRPPPATRGRRRASL